MASEICFHFPKYYCHLWVADQQRYHAINHHFQNYGFKQWKCHKNRVNICTIFQAILKAWTWIQYMTSVLKRLLCKKCKDFSGSFYLLQTQRLHSSEMVNPLNPQYTGNFLILLPFPAPNPNHISSAGCCLQFHACAPFSALEKQINNHRCSCTLYLLSV